MRLAIIYLQIGHTSLVLPQNVWKSWDSCELDLLFTIQTGNYRYLQYTPHNSNQQVLSYQRTFHYDNHFRFRKPLKQKHYSKSKYSPSSQIHIPGEETENFLTGIITESSYHHPFFFSSCESLLHKHQVMKTREKRDLWWWYDVKCCSWKIVIHSMSYGESEGIAWLLLWKQRELYIQLAQNTGE